MAEQIHIAPEVVMPLITDSQYLTKHGVAGRDLYRNALLFAESMGFSMNTYTMGADGVRMSDAQVYAHAYRAALIAERQAVSRTGLRDEHNYQVALKQWANGALDGLGEQNQQVRSSIAQVAREHVRTVREFTDSPVDKREGARRAASRMEESTEWRLNALASRRVVVTRV